MGIYVMDYKKDIEWLENLSDQEGEKLVEQLAETFPRGKDNWPRTFPAAINPKLILIGVSPGGSPNEEVDENKYLGYPSVFKPVDTDNLPVTNFMYPDKNGYWDKLRYLIKHYFPELSEREALSLSTHYNLGTDATGNPSDEDVDEDIIRWVSKLLNKVHKPDLVILFGLKGILQHDYRNAQWNHEEGLRINWNRPHYEILLQEYSDSRYHFRGWEVINDLDHKFNVVLWPNHPSRVPFGTDKIWQDSVKNYLRLLVQKKGLINK